MIRWYLEPWRKYGQFWGRSRRKELWAWNVGSLVIAIAIVNVVGSLVQDDPAEPSVWTVAAFFCFVIASVTPGIAVRARRLHDLGRSAWWLLLLCVPLLNLFFEFWLLSDDSDVGPNNYGPDPKADERE
jgi:uncharacterized membrane protein YhaH (DUF805 family)